MTVRALPTAASPATVLLTALAPAAWGTTYLVTTELLPPGRPLLAAVLRVLPVGVAMAAWCRCLPMGHWWWRSAVLGLLNVGVFQALLFVAAHRLPGGVAATAGAIQPLLVAVLAAGLLAEPLRPRTAWAGLGGVVGVGLLVLTPQAALDAVGVMAALAGTTSGAVGVVLTKRWGRPVGLLTFTGWQLVAGGLVILPLALLVEGLPPAIDAGGWAGVAWLAVVGTGVAYALWFRGLERLPVSQLSFLILVSPLVATAIGWAVLGQSLTVGQLAGAALIAVTVIWTQRRSVPGRVVAAPAPLTDCRGHRRAHPHRQLVPAGLLTGRSAGHPLDLPLPRRRRPHRQPPPAARAGAQRDAGRQLLHHRAAGTGEGAAAGPDDLAGPRRPPGRG